ncbi:MAG: transglutaminase domain-containing protein [Deltaproteobacteria bacterium]|nr:transglutaminase domain-containing protein [Deltaproteobacteria bacterium]
MGSIGTGSPVDSRYLEPTAVIDSDNPAVKEYAAETVEGAGDSAVDKALRLYYRVRDDIWYDPYTPFYRPEHYRAGFVLERKRGFCVPKASLLCALGRACGIPARVGFADVRNHLATRQLIETIGSDLFVYHGYVEFHLNGSWIKATPAFNAQLCRRHDVEPLEFDGVRDSIFQPFNRNNQQFMEYVADHGTHADIPVEAIVSAWKRAYGEDRVRHWITQYETHGRLRHRDFLKEDVVKG